MTNPTFQFPTSNPPMGIQRTFWSAKAGTREFLVADDNGEVTEYVDRITIDRLSIRVKGPDGQETYAGLLPPKNRLTEAEVHAKSQALLKELGLEKQLAFDSANEGEAGHTWGVRYNRRFKDISYRGQDATLFYDNDKKQLYRFFLGFTTREYKEVAPKITSERAAATAKQKMVEIKFEYDQDSGKPYLDIQDAGASAEGGLHDCRLCWEMVFIQHRNRTIYYNLVSIDAETGVVLGIEKSSRRDPKAPPLMPPPIFPEEVR